MKKKKIRPTEKSEDKRGLQKERSSRGRWARGPRKGKPVGAKRKGGKKRGQDMVARMRRELQSTLGGTEEKRVTPRTGGGG